MATNSTRKSSARRTVLVTGGAGYVGSHACKALAAAGYRPVTYDNLSRGHARAVKWGPLERGDLLDTARLDKVLRKRRPAAVLHFAALAYVGESVREPERYYLNNVAGTISLLDAMAANGIRRIVFSSSCAVYGAPRRVPIREGDAQRPVNPYGDTKRVVEQLLRERAADGLRSVALRYFNAAGADPEGELGESHDPETHLIPLVLQVAAGLRPRFTVYGSNYRTPDGTCIRDYVHVSDLADAHVLALKYLGKTSGARSKGTHCAVNLGTGSGHSVREVIDAARGVTGRRIPVRYGARRPGDPPRLVADPRRARRALGWSPRHSSLQEIVATAWARLRRRRYIPV
jgi:UDP-arabinose 4-epimerase